MTSVTIASKNRRKDKGARHTWALERFDALLKAVDLPRETWFFGLRICAAMLAALYVAFWLELDSPASAPTCVAILALPKRGQAFSKGVYRLAGTGVGFFASLTIAAAFGQDRVVFLLAVAVWLGGCAFLANYLEATRAYGALLSGYTVAIIAVANIDAPQNVFMAGVTRIAAITVGVLAVTIVNDVLSAPRAYSTVRDLLYRSVAEVRSAVERAVAGEPLSPGATSEILGLIGRTRAEVYGVVAEFADGRSRAAAARSAIVTMYCLVAATRPIAREAARGEDTCGAVREEIVKTLAGLGSFPHGSSSKVDEASEQFRPSLANHHGSQMLEELNLLQHELAAFEGHHPPRRPVHLPAYRDFREASLNAARAVVTFGCAAFLFLLSGWPNTSGGLVQATTLAALGSLAPDPRAFAVGTLFGVPAAMLAGGLLLYFVLTGPNEFALLAIVMAPVIVLACVLITMPLFSTFGFILLVYFPVAISPSNPQPYDLQLFLDTTILYSAAAAAVFVVTQFGLIVDKRRRAVRVLAEAREEAFARARNVGFDHPPLSLLGDRVLLLSASGRSNGATGYAALERLMTFAEMEIAAFHAHRHLGRLARSVGELTPDAGSSVGSPPDGELRRYILEATQAVATGSPDTIVRSSERLRSLELPEGSRNAALIAAQHLDVLAALIAREPRRLSRRTGGSKSRL